jgi:hypothetical protein
MDGLSAANSARKKENMAKYATERDANTDFTVFARNGCGKGGRSTRKVEP